MTRQYFKGTLTPSPIVRGFSGDTYGTHHSVLGVGGFMEVKTVAERDLIPTDSMNGLYFDQISTGQRRLGMLVFVNDDKTIYQLEPSVKFSTWSGYTPTQKYNDLADNNNWATLISISGQSVNGERIFKSFIQPVHGFSWGDVIGFNSASNNFIKSSSANATTTEPLGIVSEIKSINEFNLTFSGYINTSGMTDYSGGTLSDGTLYYVSSTLGKLTKYEPTALTVMSKPILATLLDGESGIVLQYNGKVKTQEGVTYSEYTGYTATTQQFLNKAVTGGTNIGFFDGKTGIQMLNIGTPVPNNGFYYSLYNYYYRDSSGIIRIGTPTNDGIKRQGYLRNDSLKSWIWNEFTGSSNQIGWILVNGDISTNVGLGLTGITYTGTPYSGTSWTNGVYYNNGGNLVLQVTGSTSTGTTFTNQGPIFSDKVNKILEFRTIQSKDTSSIKVTYDDNFVFVSGSSQNNTVTGAANGLTKNGYNVELGGTLNKDTIIDGSGNTYGVDYTDLKKFKIFSDEIVVSDESLVPVGAVYNADYSANFVDRSLVDKAYVRSQLNSAVRNTIIVTADTYTVLDGDYYIGVKTNSSHVVPSGYNVFLPTIPQDGRELVVADSGGDGGSGTHTNIHVWGTGGKPILNWSEAVINTNYGSITFLYNGYFWSVIGFSSAPAYA